MNGLGVKIKIIISLFAVATVLVTAIVILNYVKMGKKPAGEKSLPQTIDKDEAEERFLQAFENWGFSEAWIKSYKVNSRKIKTDKIYRITFPRNISIDFILLELNELFSNTENAKVFSKDLTKKRKTEINVEIAGAPVIIAYAKTDRKLYRENIYASIILDGREDEIENVINLQLQPTDFAKSVLINVGGEYLKPAQKLKSNGFDCAFLIDDGIEEYRYSLSSDLSRDELKSSVKRIVNDFGKENIYFYNERSKLANSPHFEFVKKHFGEYVKLLGFSYITDLTKKKDAVEIKAAIKLLITSGKQKVFLLKKSVYDSLEKFFTDLTKKGVVFLDAKTYISG